MTGGGGGANMVKRKELQFGSKGRVCEGDVSFPAQSAEEKFLQDVRKQIRGIFTKQS